MKNIINFIKENKWHILIILLGSILVLIPAMHSNIWFDESYSVSIVNHSFIDIWKIGANDVHPILYYWLLKIVSLIFGNSILIYRIFSVIGVISLSILGLTHIRKDDGKKVGIIFSILALFLPIIGNYGLEVRMYSWTIFFVSCMAIYARRFIKEKNLKNAILFGIFSIASCYMHYYALMAAAVINVGLIIYVIKHKENFKDSFKSFFIIEGLQILAYLPWMVAFITQVIHVKGGFWITLEFPKIVWDILSFQLQGNLSQLLPLILSILLLGYISYLAYKTYKKEKKVDGLIAIFLYIIVIVLALIASIKTPILNVRYLFTITVFWIYFIAFYLAKEKKNFIVYSVCILISIMGIYNMTLNYKDNYDQSNGKQIAFLQENMKDDDIIIYRDIINGGVIASLYPDSEQYFMNLENWNIKEAYKAYSPTMEVLDNFSQIPSHKRLIIIDNANYDFYNTFPNKERYKIVKEEVINTKYKNYTFGIKILEKV